MGVLKWGRVLHHCNVFCLLHFLSFRIKYFVHGFLNLFSLLFFFHVRAVTVFTPSFPLSSYFSSLLFFSLLLFLFSSFLFPPLISLLFFSFPSSYFSSLSSHSLSLSGYTEIGSFPYPKELKHNLIENKTKLIQFVKYIQCKENTQNTELKDDNAFPLKNERNCKFSSNAEGIKNGCNNREKEDSTKGGLNVRTNKNNNKSLPPHWRSVQPVRPNTDGFDDGYHSGYHGGYAARNGINSGYTGRCTNSEDGTSPNPNSKESIDSNINDDIRNDFDVNVNYRIDNNIDNNIGNKIDNKIDNNKKTHDNNILSSRTTLKNNQTGHLTSTIRTHTFSLSDTIEESFDLLCMD
jgi:hypothetical protein